MKHSRILLVCILALAVTVFPQTAGKAKTAVAVVAIDTPMEGPAWAKLERQVLDTSTPALVEFYRKYYDSRGYLQCVLRWGADDGPDDAFENFAGWPDHSPSLRSCLTTFLCGKVRPLFSPRVIGTCTTCGS